MEQFKLILQDFQKCIAVAPLSILALIFYLALRSTTILPDGLHQFNGIYHPAYLGWYDFVLGYSIIFSFVTGALELELKDIFLGLALLLIISASWLGTYEEDKKFIYYPHPETKIGHFQDDSILEAIAPKIPHLNYGDRLILKLAPQEIKLMVDA
ncbi:MAG: hypothetical protein ACFCU7_19755 [Pleurocapsa sp.]